MKSLGKLSGKVYEKNEICSIPECLVTITDAQASDPSYLATKRKEFRESCALCRECPAYKEFC